MTREESLLRALCHEVVEKGVQTDRFTELWLASGVNLESAELDIANRLLQRHSEEKKLQPQILH